MCMHLTGIENCEAPKMLQYKSRSQEGGSALLARAGEIVEWEVGEQRKTLWESGSYSRYNL